MNGGRLLVGGLLTAAVYYAVFGGEYSVFELRATRADIEVTGEQLAEVKARIDSLRAWADSLENDPATIERVAREDFGMIRDGEMLYRFVEVDEDDPGAEEPAR
jgi:cell division protein FtsB